MLLASGLVLTAAGLGPCSHRTSRTSMTPAKAMSMLRSSGKDIYPPDDARAKWFAANGVSPVENMPLLQDSERPPINPRGGTRPMRDDYNSRTPLTLMMDGVWLMSARNAAWREDVLLRNGIQTTLCVAAGGTAREQKMCGTSRRWT